MRKSRQPDRLAGRTPFNEPSSDALPPYRRREWQERAVYEVVTQAHVPKDPRPEVVERFRADDAFARGARIQELLEAIEALAKSHQLPELFLEMGTADRDLEALLGRTPEAESVLADLVPVATPENLNILLRSPLFFDSLRRAWELSAEGRPDRELKVRQARQLLTTVIEVLSAPLSIKKLHPVVRAKRSEGAAAMFEARLREWVPLITAMHKASKEYDDRRDILRELVKWREIYLCSRGLVVGEYDPLFPYSPSSDDREARPIKNAGPASCPTCGNDPLRAAATALSVFRQDRQKKNQRGPFPYREIAATVLLHRCPDRLDPRAAAKALERLEKRINTGNRPHLSSPG